MAVYNRGSIGLFFRGDPTLKAWWTLNDTLIDNGSNGSHLSVNGTVPIAVSKFGLGRYFNGQTGNYLSASAFTISEPYTLMCWVKTTSTQSYTGIFGTDDAPNTAGTFTMLYVSDTGTLRMQIQKGSSSNYRTIKGSIKINDDKWHLIIGVQASGGDLHLFVDGQEDTITTESSAGSIASYSSNNTFLIGCERNYSAGYFLLGTVGEGAVFARNLNKQEISQYYKWATQTQRKTKYILFSPTTALQSIALQSTLEALQKSPTALQTTLERGIIDTTAITSLLEKTGSVSTALQALLEKAEQSTVALSADLHHQLTTTVALGADLELPPRTTVALFTTLYRPKKVFPLDNLDKNKATLLDNLDKNLSILTSIRKP